MQTAVAVDRGLGSAFFLRMRTVRGPDDGKQLWMQTIRGSKLHLAHINLRSSGRMCPAEKQTMQLQARAACVSAVHALAQREGVRKSSVV